MPTNLKWHISKEYSGVMFTDLGDTKAAVGFSLRSVAYAGSILKEGADHAWVKEGFETMEEAQQWCEDVLEGRITLTKETEETGPEISPEEEVDNGRLN